MQRDCYEDFGPKLSDSSICFNTQNNSNVGDKRDQTWVSTAKSIFCFLPGNYAI